MDFYAIRTKTIKETTFAYPDWVVGQTEDLLVRGGGFHAVWDEDRGLWSTSEYDVQRLVDRDIAAFVEEAASRGEPCTPLFTRNFGSGMWETFNRYLRNLPNVGPTKQLDDSLTFENTEVKKKDYASKRLPYSLKPGNTDAWDELLSVLYAPDERDKIEWTIGAIVSGESKRLQKFLVFHGPPGSGKSTVIEVIEKLFEGYTAAFEAKELTSSNGQFAMEPFQHNPLVAIQHDGDLSRIEDNTRINSIVGHDTMQINVKYRSSFPVKPSALLILGTNKPVMITDAKAGLTRRLIDVHPTGAKIVPARYHVLVENVNYELGAIAQKCLDRFHQMGKYYYEGYVPTRMMAMTNSFYNFVEAHYDIFKSADGIQLKQIWPLYKEYCEDKNITKPLQYHQLRDEVGNYFQEFRDRHVVDGKEHRSVYFGFKGLPGDSHPAFVPDTSYVVELDDSYDSAFDIAYPDQPAQYAADDGKPEKKWVNVDTTLANLDTTKLHYVKVPTHHIVVDFDLVGDDGKKSLERNIEAASKMPPTYAEVSKSGRGLHLHYIFDGDVSHLRGAIAPGIEVKTLLGDSSLRRRKSRCNNLAISRISAGLPLKEEKPVLDTKSIMTEKGLRDLIDRNLRKEIHPGTKPSIDFIHHILEEAYNDGLHYDVTDLKPILLTFALQSSNQSDACLRLVQDMKFASEKPMAESAEEEESPLVFFDIEVYPNLFVVCWKAQKSDNVVKMINPKAGDVEPLLGMKLIGFNNRRYDNHILYAAFMGYNNAQLFQLSQNLISKDGHKHSFGEAYNLSYADIYDFSSKKQGLKKFQLELGIFHMELDLPWDEDVPEDMWMKVVEYCANDVISTEAVFDARKQDFAARQILAELSGLTVNHTTQQHTARILFGDDKNANKKFIYTDLSETFHGYEFNGKESTYLGEVTGEGGYVYAEPGYYENVAVLDVASMHPTSIVELNLFGPYTERFEDLIEARLAIKRKDYQGAATLLGGKLAKFVQDEEGLDELAYALKIVINIVYGLTSAKFDNPFRDIRNKDNIVAKRGALFMINLKQAVQEKGYTVAHIKTDSIKIPNADQHIIEFVTKFGEAYGYHFEHETTYEKFCLVNDAVYVARSLGQWTATGAQFAHPYVFKELFSHEPLEFDDLCEVKSVTKGRIYLSFDEQAPPRHVGRTGSFMPVRYDGGVLWRIDEDKKYHVTGTSGYRWIERDRALARDNEGELVTDMEFFEELRTDAIKAIEKFVPYQELVA